MNELTKTYPRFRLQKYDFWLEWQSLAAFFFMALSLKQVAFASFRFFDGTITILLG